VEVWVPVEAGNGIAEAAVERVLEQVAAFQLRLQQQQLITCVRRALVTLQFAEA